MNKLLLAVSVLGLAACGVNLPPSFVAPPDLPPGTKPPPSIVTETSNPPVNIVRQAQLVTFPACVDLEGAVRAKLISVMRSQLNESYKTALVYYRNGYYGWGFADAGVAGGGGGTGGGSGTGGGAGGGPTNVTTTNLQVAGVDEADIIKNDGTRIFVLSKGKLFASRSWPAADLAVAGSLAIPGTTAEMFLDGDRVVVFSNIWLQNDQQTLATLIDVSNLASLKIVGQYEVPGSYRSARRIGKSVRLVTSRSFAWPVNVSTYLPYWNNPWKDEAAIYNAFTKQLADNEAKLNAARIDQLLPAARWHGLTDATFDVDCASVHLSTGSSALGYSEVSTFQIDVDAKLDRQVLYEAANEVYADDDSLYFTSHHWWWWGTPGADATYIHKFDTSMPGQAKYAATGVIDGYLVDQFSMDEHKGNLRVAATARSSQGLWNEVTVLAQSGQRLVQIGKSEKLAQNERITSARFMGDVGYVVTFRQTDPLFIFDLKDPTHPVKVGELKVPGFSSYIHPLDPTHLLTIGTYQPESGGWQNRAVQLAIFDVSDLTAPKQTHLQLLGNFSASSEAQQQHKAFNYFAEKKLLAVPFYEWASGQTSGGHTSYWYELKSDLRVFSVDALQGFTPRGAVPMSDLSTRAYYYSSDAIVRRSVMADDCVYAISEAGIRVSKIDALETPLATAKF